ncbi:MAG: peptide-methionine (R)-S-oxide reductase MsrB [Flavobacteriaceae bacterium]|nr:peptide-methionine (R)-S-oxide reductase MsrB [Flavobacteriaceae bacterium]
MLLWKDIIHYSSNGNPTPPKRVEKTEEEWKAILDEHTFRITRLHGTEAPNTGAHCSSFDPGIYHCACCQTPLFDASIKFDSGTGWPSFTQPISKDIVQYKKDSSFGMIRVEILCNVCDAHLGHVFPDGPEPSGLRYCVNSASLTKQQ